MEQTTVDQPAQTAEPISPKPAPEPPAGLPPGLPRGQLPKEIGGPAGPEPTRYGDWEQKGRCTDF